MLGQGFNLKSSDFLARPLGSQHRPVSRAKIGQRHSFVVHFKKSPQDAMESPAPAAANTSNGTEAPVAKTETPKAPETPLVRSDSVPVTKRKDGVGGFGPIKSSYQCSCCWENLI